MEPALFSLESELKCVAAITRRSIHKSHQESRRRFEIEGFVTRLHRFPTLATFSAMNQFDMFKVILSIQALFAPDFATMPQNPRHDLFSGSKSCWPRNLNHDVFPA